MEKFSRYSMVICYLLAGINHFWHPSMYEKIIPSILPAPLLLVYISGVCEIVFALLLLPKISRRLAAWLIIALLVAVFPANIQMTIDFARAHNPDTWLTIVRLPIQLLLIAWAWHFAKKVRPS